MSSFRRKANRKNLKNFKKDVNYSADLGHKSKHDVLVAYYHQNRADTKIWQETICDMMILFCYALYTEYGFARKRIERFYEKAVMISACLREKKVKLQELEQILRDEARYEYPHDAFCNHYSHENQIRLKTIEEMSIIFYFSVYEIWGFQEKRLIRIQKRIAAEANALAEKKLTMEDLERVLHEKAKANFDKTFHPGIVVEQVNEEETA